MKGRAKQQKVCMSKKSPLVSIGMPLYNEGKHLRQSLDCLLAQDFQDFELIISDNSSCDGTQNICLEYAGRDGRIRYYRNELNAGFVENFNRVFRLSSGEYFMWAAGHDLWARRFISRCVEILQQDPTVVLCYPQLVLIDRDGKELGLGEKSRFTDTRNLSLFLRFNLAAWGSGNSNKIYGLIRASALGETRLSRKVLGPEYVLLTELALLGSFAFIPEVLFYSRMKWGDENMRKERWIRFFRMADPETEVRRIWFPYLSLSYEQLLGVTHARLGYGRKVLLMLGVILAYFGGYRRYLPRNLRLAFLAFLKRCLDMMVRKNRVQKSKRSPSAASEPATKV